MKHLLFVIPIFMCFTITRAQSISKQVLGSSGTHISSETYHLNFTVGETIAGRIENGHIISQGFWSELNNSALLNQQEFNEPIQSISVHPNPVVNNLYIKFKGQSPDDYSYQLFDANGKKILGIQETSETSETLKLDISALSDGIYMLLITSLSSNVNQSFKIIKN